VRRAELPGDGVAVVQGGGGMGLLHLLVIAAEHPGVATLVVDPLEERRALATTLGAAAVAAPGEDAASSVKQLSDGLGADAVFDTVGGSGPLESALALTRAGGAAILFAHAPDGERAGFDLNTLFKHERRIMGTYSGGLHEQSRVFDLMVDRKLDPSPLVSHRMRLAAFADGVDIARRREALKILFTP
ncbi:MAG: zinc-binding dehydrogenase, partial [Gammaproteobacteria bacterium]|nr:zinc-binding dehydrogenase [Gammaproteobacteria bacterium]